MGQEAGDHVDHDHGDARPPVVVCKGKRSKRQRVHAVPPVTAEDESSSSAVKGWRRSGADQREDEDMALCLMLLARGGKSSSPVVVAAESTVKEGKFRSRRPADCAGEFVFECWTCGRRFPSFQALGGHRTSHKKPRLLLLPPTPALPPTSTLFPSSEQKRRPPVLLEEKAPSPLLSPHARADPTVLAIPAIRAMSGASRQQQQWRVHECSICGAEFASGQALGGHMRRHRPLVPASLDSDMGAAPVISRNERSLLELLDLNMPAPCDEATHDPRDDLAGDSVAGVPLLAIKQRIGN
ncbi:hypothetical protein QYE76_057871 [Lolium multiflorum]|uniref:C2H2-type domain-containing protein n=1 Tax=Lolium multiflorum TaxID=4521 RepID=A0AAD8WPB5_LOLMU|nr:hypothetical protein QYE76_057871 [Lolium multiflorum]